MNKVNPLILISRCIPEELTELTGEFLDKLHLVLSATGIHHSANRDEVFMILRDALVEIELASIVQETSPKKIKIKQGNNAIKIIAEYGKG